MTKIKGYIWFTYDGCGLSVAKKLMDEGKTVIVAQIQDVKELHNPARNTEEPEKRKKRLSVYNGILPKFEAKDIISKMAKMPNKEEWFVVFDLNSLWFYSQQALHMGFTNGFFPTEEDTLFEDDRNKGKDLVKEFWDYLEVAPVEEFKTVEEGIAYMTENPEDIFVLKGNDDGAATVLPSSEDPALAREELIGALQTGKADYEKGGFILELRITNPIEITPQIVFYNGKPIFTDVDIENKPIGAGSIGNMTGCAGNLIIQTNLEDEINSIAFPDKVFEMAAKHPGLFIWDASILIDSRTNELYFGEFCPNRWGYDAFFTELGMCESVSSYFESIVNGKNPLKKRFGVAIRMMNIANFEDANLAIKGDEQNLFFFDIQKKDEHYISIGSDWALAVSVAGDNDIMKTVDEAYENLKRVSFTSGYYRPKFDFISKEYQNSIPNRYEFANHWLFDEAEFNASQEVHDEVAKVKVRFDRAINKLTQSKDKELEKLNKKIESILAI